MVDDPLVDSHLAWLSAHLTPAPLLVGYSGGLDSHVLLCWLARFVARFPAFSLQAVHVHHGLNPLADAWAAHCQRVCAELGVPLIIERVAVMVARRESLEARAREARYRALAQHLPAGGYLLTAHHQDDQLETLLLALKRGSGVRGLAAMPPRQPFAQGELIRPLLDCARASLQRWAEEQGLRWIEDDSNQDERFDRNFLRAQILPRLQARWPSFGETAGRSASLCAEQEALAEELAAQDRARCERVDGSLSIAALSELSIPRRHNLLRGWLRHHSGVAPERAALLRIWPEVVEARADAAPQLVTACGQIRRFDGALYLLSENPIAQPEPRLLSGPGPWLVGCHRLSLDRVELGAQLRLPRDDEPLSLRFAVSGSLRTQPVGRVGSRPLKKLWQEYRVAPWLRDQVPLLFYGETLVAAVGLFICQAGAAEGEPGLQLRWEAF